MLFRDILGLLGSTFKARLYVSTRSLHEVLHSPNRSLFYIVLDEVYDKKAVLIYRITSQIMDLRAVNVPSAFKGRGLARLLTETAFTYAIVNDYYLYLTCSYAQKYYLANKSRGLKERVIGPKSLLDLSVSLDPETFEELVDPEDKVDGGKKS